jgi:hypothetical protein
MSLHTRFTWLCVGVTFLLTFVGTGLLVNTYGHGPTSQPTEPAPDPTICAAAAFLAYDAYAGDDAPLELEAAMEACADTVGGF